MIEATTTLTRADPHDDDGYGQRKHARSAAEMRSRLREPGVPRGAAHATVLSGRLAGNITFTRAIQIDHCHCIDAFDISHLVILALLALVNIHSNLKHAEVLKIIILFNNLYFYFPLRIQILLMPKLLPTRSALPVPAVCIPAPGHRRCRRGSRIRSGLRWSAARSAGVLRVGGWRRCLVRAVHRG